MFDIDTSKSIDEGKLSLYSKKFSGSIEFIGRTRENNGVKGYVERLENVMPNTKDVISVSQVGTITAQIRNSIWYASQNIFILKPRQDKKLVCCGILTAINVTLRGNFCDGYSKYPTLKTLKNLCIQLPTKNGKIDFEFMEQFVAELEARQLAELDNYLKVTGLKDYNLTTQEQQALEDFDKLEWSEFDVTGDNGIFDVKNTGNILGSDIVPGSGKTPYLCASAENNAVSSYIDYDKNLLDKGNCIFIGGKTFVVTYQKEDFYSNDSHNLVLYLKTQERDRYNQLYLATCISKSLGHKYTWGDSISGKKIKRDKVNLPVKDGNVCFDFMQTFISAIQKLVIKDVVLYNESRLKATEKVIGKA